MSILFWRSYYPLTFSSTHFHSHAIKWRDPLVESNVYILGKCKEREKRTRAYNKSEQESNRTLLCPVRKENTTSRLCDPFLSHIALCTSLDERENNVNTYQNDIYVIAYLIMITYSLVSAVVIDASIFMRGIIHLCCKCRSHSFCIDSLSISTFSPSHHFHNDWSHWNDIKYWFWASGYYRVLFFILHSKIYKLFTDK